MRHSASGSVALFAFAMLVPLGASAQRPFPLRDRLESERCSPASGDIASLGGTRWLERARAATGLSAASGRIVHWRSTESEAQAYQSDRPYPPYIGSSALREWWFDPASGVERWQSVPANGAVLRTASAAFMLRDSVPRPVPPLFAFYESSRALNPLAILADFGKANVRVAEVCTFRDFPRVVLAGDEGRLYLDAKSAMPVKFERVERNDLWGQLRAEYVYATWWRTGQIALPIVAVRYIDGVEQLRRDVALPQTRDDKVVEDVAIAAAPSLVAPAGDQRAAATPRITPVTVDTIRVADNLFLLRTPQYTHAVTQVGDTAYLFEATTGDAVGSSRVDLQACKLEYSIVSPK